MRPGRTLLVAGLVGGVALVGGSERAGAVRLEPVPEPAILTFPGTKRITYRLRIYGEEREERFILGINPPRFGGEPVPRDRRSAGARAPGIYGQEGVLAQPIFGQRIVFGDATPVSSGFAILSSPIPHASASCSSPDTRRTCAGGNTGWIGSPGPGRSTLNPPR